MINTSSPWGKSERRASIDTLTDSVYDLIIIGGGVTGAGIALDAASRGLRPLLIEKADFASGTSSKSTKLIHGGLRYLKQLEFGLVRETGTERAIVHRLAPHLVHPEKMLLPIVEDGEFNLWTATMAISVYDFLAKVKSDDKKQRLSAQETLDSEPQLDDKIVKGGVLYSEYRTDDARLTLELVRQAVAQGAVALSYMECTDIIYSEGRVSGVQLTDRSDGADGIYMVHCAKVISAAGPWVDHLRKIDGSLSSKSIRHTKGVHLVFARKRLPVRQSIYFDDFDGRMIFAIPRGNRTYVGTTDTDYKGDLDNILATDEDADYLLRCANVIFPGAALVPADIQSTWAGVRPLIEESGKSASEISRKDEIFVSDTGLISIAGGKLTGYRKMAQRVLDTLLKRHDDLSATPCKTVDLKIVQPAFADYDAVQARIRDVEELLADTQLGAYRPEYLVTMYGKSSQILVDQLLASDDQSEIALLLLEIDYCCDHEMALTLIDVLERRTARLYFDLDYVREHLDTIVNHMAQRESWDTDRQAQERALLLDRISALNPWYGGE